MMKICVALLMFSMLLLVSVQQGVSEMQQARADAERDAERYVFSLAWGAVGFGCGCFGLAYAYLAIPEIPVGVLFEKPPTCVAMYTQVYQQSVTGCAPLQSRRAYLLGYFFNMFISQN